MDWTFYPATVPARGAVHMHAFPNGSITTMIRDRPHPTPLVWVDPRGKDRGAYYPHMLVSYYHWRKSRHLELFPEEINLFGDSGGYTLLTNPDTVIDPRDVITWQLGHTNVGAILDVPPFGPNRELRWGHLDRTLRNIELALPIYRAAFESGHSFRWWGVVQGRTHQEIRSWYEAVRGLYPFEEEGEGWAMKPLPTTDPSAIARCLRLAHREGITSFHSLMTTSVSTVAALFVVGQWAGIERLTFDSSTGDQFGKNRKIAALTDDGLAYYELEEKYRDKGETHARDYLFDECTCGSCQYLREDYPDRDVPNDGSYLAQRMLFHNVLTLQHMFRNMWKEARNHPDEYLRATVGTRKYHHILRTFEGRNVQTTPRGENRSLLDYLL